MTPYVHLHVHYDLPLSIRELREGSSIFLFNADRLKQRNKEKARVLVTFSTFAAGFGNDGCMYLEGMNRAGLKITTHLQN